MPAARASAGVLPLTIRALIHEGVDDWVEAIPLVELCVNNAVADSTEVSPTAFTYG